MSIKSAMPSNHRILYCPVLLRPSIFPSIRILSKESVLHIRWLSPWWRVMEWQQDWIKFRKWVGRDFPSGPWLRTFQCRWPRFNSWSGNKDPKSKWCGQKKKKKNHFLFFHYQWSSVTPPAKCGLGIRSKHLLHFSLLNELEISTLKFHPFEWQIYSTWKAKDGTSPKIPPSVLHCHVPRAV